MTLSIAQWLENGSRAFQMLPETALRLKKCHQDYQYVVGEVLHFGSVNAYLLLLLKKYTQTTTKNKAVAQFQSFGSMYAGFVRQSGLDDAVDML
jgi:hypothetical protein